jgi:hypothetical protein
MPTSQINAADPIATTVACPQLLTPPPEFDEAIDTAGEPAERRHMVDDGEMNYGAGDNTAHGMAYEQEMSMYITHNDDMPHAIAVSRDEGDKDKTASVEGVDTRQQAVHNNQRNRDTARPTSTGSVSSIPPSPPCEKVDVPEGDVAQEVHTRAMWKMEDNDRHSREDTEISTHTDLPSRSQASSPATQTSDKPIHRSTTTYPSTPSWDFTHIQQAPHYPSSLLRPGSKFTGSQQSDRQIYNVDVDILTIDTTQSSLTGYLRICGLTEDHPTLTTFFSGEIIGGPSHKYSFRTRTPTWGATDKTDLIHWARFPAWRPLSKEAKRDIDFPYPLDGGEWWQQENVYMRWKEHFLVPDHRVRSIAGASFEGFYYATFNQVEGRISGIYFHAKSER